jgi:hypothetical protein
MSQLERGNQWYGDAQADIRDELLCYSRLNGYPAEQSRSPPWCRWLRIVAMSGGSTWAAAARPAG